MFNKPIVVAEIGQAHDGSLGILHSYIDSVARTGADAIKFQIHYASYESSEYEPFRVPFSYEDHNRYAYWKRMELTIDQWVSVRKHCDEVGLTFIATPFSRYAVSVLERLDTPIYKVGSGDIDNFLMLEAIRCTKKPVILSTGLCLSTDHLSTTVDFLQLPPNNLGILQCTTSYPTKMSDIGLEWITFFKGKYKSPVGLSDHSGTIYPCLAAVSLGATILEVHVTYDKQMFGPDSTSSLTLSELSQLCDGVNAITTALQPSNKFSQSALKTSNINIFGRSIAVTRDLPQNHILTISDLEALKPANMGIPSSSYESIIGLKLRKPLTQFSFIQPTDLSDV